VYDVHGDFPKKCNPEMVDLDPVSEDDVAVLKRMIHEHYLYTGSSVAKFVHEDFDNQVQHFVKVFPKDYKKVLSAGQKQKSGISAGK
jgi:glutamate synthase (NADPH/NADH) large chain